MESNFSQSVMTTSRVKTTILEWIQITSEFHYQYNKINAMLQDRYNGYSSDSTMVPSGNGLNRRRRLNKLRQHMKNVLETLLADMNNSFPGSRHTDNCNNLPQADILVTHTRLLKDVNRKISKELVVLTEFQA